VNDVPKIVYIAGASRSGSTLLAMLIGALPGCVSIGELRHVWRRGIQLNQRCGCGEPFWDCSFWTAVGSEAFGGWEHAPSERMVSLQERVDRFRQLPKLAAMPLFAGVQREVEEYATTVGMVYQAVTRASGSSVVVDSSKGPSFVMILPRVPQVTGVVIHLIRDSRAVAHSWSRQRRLPEVTDGTEYMPIHGPVRSAVDWTRSNLAIESARLARLPATRLRYERLVRGGIDELRQVCVTLGLNDSETALLTESTIPVGVQHTVAGNPARFAAGGLRLRPDEEWKRAMPGPRRRIVEGITWPMLAAYGYSLRS
jgi:sulfotransferase family protein